jgi:putative redox protein
MRKATLVQVSGMRFDGVMEDGARTVLHVPAAGEAKAGPSPMEHVALGLAGCTAADVVGILAKSREPLEQLRVDLEYERATTHPKVITTAVLHFVGRGRGLSEDKLRHAIELSQEKYCSVSAMLRRAGAAITWDARVESETQSLK